MKKLLSGLLAVLLLTACAKDGVLLRGGQDMVLIRDGKLLTDNGLIFTVAEDGTPSEWRSWQRAFITCDLLRQKSSAEFDIRLTEAHKVLLKEALTEGELPEEEIGDDPIDVVRGWISGGYLNLLFRIAYDPSSGQAHFINLVYLGQEDSVLRFRLRQNSYGYYFGAPGLEGMPGFGIGYVSFPISRFLPEGKDAALVEMTWKWHITEGGELLPQTEEKSDRALLRRAG